MNRLQSYKLDSDKQQPRTDWPDTESLIQFKIVCLIEVSTTFYNYYNFKS